ncbi:hypothetical protein ABZ250_37555 [Streptomyces afghaniensis]|uniref:hypothetical protein n=1 Tax=Streptomyces afghaniensis TaxID=66865 RepID=UPI0033B23C8D
MTTDLHRRPLGASAASDGKRPEAPHDSGARSGAVGIRDVVRWWPLVVLTTLAAVVASVVALGPRAPSYSSTARMPVTPLAQSDETFLGTSLVRDAGDANRTSSTVARLLDSHRVALETAQSLGGRWTPGSVRSAVDVTVGETNMIEITARAADPDQAVRLARTFAQTALNDRWQTISAQLDRRIAFTTRNTAADPNAGEESRRLQLLTFVRESGADPTLSIDSVSPAERVKEMPAAVMIGMAAVGGMFLGVLGAVGIERVRRRAQHDDVAPAGREPDVAAPEIIRK